MVDAITKFLITNYGNRVDQPQPLADSDETSLSRQLELVDKRVRYANVLSTIWATLGIIWLTASAYALGSNSFNALTCSKLRWGLCIWLLAFGKSRALVN